MIVVVLLWAVEAAPTGAVTFAESESVVEAGSAERGGERNASLVRESEGVDAMVAGVEEGVAEAVALLSGLEREVVLVVLGLWDEVAGSTRELVDCVLVVEVVVV